MERKFGKKATACAADIVTAAPPETENGTTAPSKPARMSRKTFEAAYKTIGWTIRETTARAVNGNTAHAVSGNTAHATSEKTPKAPLCLNEISEKELSALKLDELRLLATANGVAGASKMNKSELVRALCECRETAAHTASTPETTETETPETEAAAYDEAG
jgi:hypothetical protein